MNSCVTLVTYLLEPLRYFIFDGSIDLPTEGVKGWSLKAPMAYAWVNPMKCVESHVDF